MKKDYKRKGENTRKKPLNFSRENVLIIIIEISQLDCHDQNYMHVINKLKVAKLFADRLWFSSLRTKYMVVQFCMLDTSYILRSYTNIQYVNVSMQHNNINFMQNITQFIDPEVKSFHVKKNIVKIFWAVDFRPYVTSTIQEDLYIQYIDMRVINVTPMTQQNYINQDRLNVT